MNLGEVLNAVVTQPNVLRSHWKEYAVGCDFTTGGRMQRLQAFEQTQRAQCACICSNTDVISGTYSEPVKCYRAGSAVFGEY